MTTPSTRWGYTLRDMFVAITCLAVLLAIVVPLIQNSRCRSQRLSCNDNLKQIGLALQNYHDTYKTFPMGAMHSGPRPDRATTRDATLGPSWWFGIMPFAESRNYYSAIMQTQRPGLLARHRFCANDMLSAGVALNRITSEYLHCYRSPLPYMETRTGPIPLPTYVGIGGACDIDPNSDDYRDPALAGIALLKASPAYHNKFKGTSATPGGVATASGMLPPCVHVSMAECLDGTSNVMIVGEQSDWLRDRNPAVTRTWHGDAGWTVGGTAFGGGFLSGTTRVDPVPAVAQPGGPPAVWGADCWNITTVRYPPNLKRVLGANALPGCSENHGINNPLQSPHPGGLLVAFVDGSVQFVNQLTDLTVLLRMAIRDDGQQVNLP